MGAAALAAHQRRAGGRPPRLIRTLGCARAPTVRSMTLRRSAGIESSGATVTTPKQLPP